jgi:hypothetical protein
MTRFSIALVLVLLNSMTAYSGNYVVFNNSRGRTACLRSIFYRASCPVTWDANCPRLWIASLNLCREYGNTNIFAYRAAVGIWDFEKFVDDEERKHHRWLCHESDWLAKVQAESRKAGPEGTESGDANAK